MDLVVHPDGRPQHPAAIRQFVRQRLLSRRRVAGTARAGTRRWGLALDGTVALLGLNRRRSGEDTEEDKRR